MTREVPGGSVATCRAAELPGGGVARAGELPGGGVATYISRST
jgi:hypothetical protein